MTEPTAEFRQSLEHILDARFDIRGSHPLADLKGLRLVNQVLTNSNHNYSVPRLWQPEFFGTDNEVSGIDVAGDKVSLRSVTGSKRHKLVASASHPKVL